MALALGVAFTADFARAAILVLLLLDGCYEDREVCASHTSRLRENIAEPRRAPHFTLSRPGRILPDSIHYL
jgi:hypothetical protein